MSFLKFLEDHCPGDDLHDGLGDPRPLLDRCSACRDIHEAHQRALSSTFSTPEIEDFLDAVKREVVYQKARWKKTDPEKSSADWFWLIGWLGGKAVNDPHGHDDGRSLRERRLHRIITVAAAAFQWHEQEKKDNL